MSTRISSTSPSLRHASGLIAKRSCLKRSDGEYGRRCPGNYAVKRRGRTSSPCIKRKLFVD